MPTKKTTKNTQVSATVSQKELPAVFQKFYYKDGRYYLNKPKNFEEYPDLLDLQKKGFQSFIDTYLNQLFEDINPIWDIAGEKMYVTISEVKVSEPQNTIDECKKKELTYGGVISGKVKLVERVEEEGKKPAEKVWFTKRANIGTLPLMTPSASYIINGVERVIISQIIRSYGIFYNKKDFGYGFKIIPERGPWIETKVEKSGVIVVRVNKSRKFPITSLLKIYFGDEILKKIIKFGEDSAQYLKLEKLLDEEIKEKFKDNLKKLSKKGNEEGDEEFVKFVKEKRSEIFEEIRYDVSYFNIFKEVFNGEKKDKFESLVNEISQIDKEIKEKYKDDIKKLSKKGGEDVNKFMKEKKNAAFEDMRGSKDYIELFKEIDDFERRVRLKRLIDNQIIDNDKYHDYIVKQKLSEKDIEIFINDKRRRAESFDKIREDSTCIDLLKKIYDFEIEKVFSDCLDEEDTDYIGITLKKDSTADDLSAAEYIYNKLRPGELINNYSALDYIKNQFLNFERIHIGRIARRKINAKLSLNKPLDATESNLFDGEDMVAAIKYLLNLSNLKKGYYVDDSDHLSNKRVRTMGEILYAHLGPVMRKFTKSVKGKLSVLNMENQLKITDIVNFKIIDNSIKSFFATSQLSQFLDQINPLSELEHKRRITALGPGGLKRETAKFEVRDVHASHYGRICPIETPEGQNIGLVTYQSLYSRINEEGFLETPAFKVGKEVQAKKELLVNRIADRDIVELDAKGKETKKVIVAEDNVIDEKAAATIEKMYGKTNSTIKVKPFVTTEVEYISPELDEKYYIADATVSTDEFGNITSKRVAARHFDEMITLHVKDITHVDVNPSQIFSPNTSLIPFLDHNDAVRASMGTNQHRQGLPLLQNDAPLVGTGLESMIKQTHAVILAEDDGEVVYVDGKRIKVKYKSGIKEYTLTVYKRSNAKSCIHQKARVSLGQKVVKGDVLAEGPNAENGELAMGKNLKVAFMPWKGYNYEDAIVLSQRLVKNDALTSVHIEEKEIEVSDTKLGPEETTNDIPGVSMSKLKNLDEDGIIRIGSIVKGGDILVGKITPKSEGELTPEEKLIQAIFGDKSKNVKDTSLYMPSGSEGKVIEVVILDAKKGDNLMAGVRKKVKVYVATTRKIEVGDKLAGKHGNKGIVSIVVPEEDMPFSKEGDPIDVVLNPLGVISRMNLGQLFEVQMGYIAKKYGIKFGVGAFSGFGLDDFTALIKELGLEDEIHVQLYDGQTGEPFESKSTVGYMHLLKLVHMVEDKIHARSVGPYSLITQQPLGGKSRQGGQRFGEMEVWALEAYSAVYTLQEMLTVKSDDVVGRNKMYESIIKGQKLSIGGLPESFNLVTYLFKGLSQNIQTVTQEELDEILQDRVEKIKELGLHNLMKESVLSDDDNMGEDDEDTTQEEKEDIIDKVLEDMVDSGELDE